jgi:uncharacterized protein (DUF433 family)
MRIEELKNVLLRITARAILKRMGTEGVTFDEAVKSYPKLTKTQINQLKKCEEFK